MPFRIPIVALTLLLAYPLATGSLLRPQEQRAPGLVIAGTPDALPSPGPTAPAPTEKSSAVQILRASDWKGAVTSGDEGCKASHGEYAVWVYASGTQCGVPREKADRIVIFRQPLPGVAPIRATARLPGGRYAVWAYGAGDPGHPGLRLCAKGCIFGELATRPAWVSLGWIETRDDQELLVRSWEQPDGHSLYVQAIVLSLSDTPPEWVP